VPRIIVGETYAKECVSRKWDANDYSKAHPIGRDRLKIGQSTRARVNWTKRYAVPYK